MRILFYAILLLLNVQVVSFAAVGCSLNDPDRDVKRMFPESSGYLTKFITLQETGGVLAREEIENQLGDKLDTVYEDLNVPYAYYTILKGKTPIGYIHGVNQKGKFGGLQLIVATDLSLKIRDFYYQRISSPNAAKFRSGQFTAQFKGLTLDDFYQYHVQENKASAGGLSRIIDTTGSPEDFRATLRGIKKDLILLDYFLQRENNRGGK